MGRQRGRRRAVRLERIPALQPPARLQLPGRRGRRLEPGRAHHRRAGAGARRPQCQLPGHRLPAPIQLRAPRRCTRPASSTGRWSAASAAPTATSRSRNGRLSLEQTANERTWSSGSTLDGATVAAAFQLGGQPAALQAQRRGALERRSAPGLRHHHPDRVPHHRAAPGPVHLQRWQRQRLSHLGRVVRWLFERRWAQVVSSSSLFLLLSIGGSHHGH